MGSDRVSLRALAYDAAFLSLIVGVWAIAYDIMATESPYWALFPAGFTVITALVWLAARSEPSTQAVNYFENSDE